MHVNAASYSISDWLEITTYQLQSEKNGDRKNSSQVQKMWLEIFFEVKL